MPRAAGDSASQSRRSTRQDTVTAPTQQQTLRQLHRRRVGALLVLTVLAYASCHAFLAPRGPCVVTRRALTHEVLCTACVEQHVLGMKWIPTKLRYAATLAKRLLPGGVLMPPVVVKRPICPYGISSRWCLGKERPPHQVALLESFFQPRDYPTVLTQETIDVGTVLYFPEARVAMDLSEAMQWTVSPDLHSKLPARELPGISLQGYDRCALVGSAGAMAGAGWGRDIDKADLVIRSNNLAPTSHEYVSDVGSHTAFQILWIHHWTVELLRESGKTAQLQAEDSVVLWAATTPEQLFEAVRLVQETEHLFPSMVLNPRLSVDLDIIKARFRGASDTFTRNSGGIGLTVAVTMCQRIDIYGFVPARFDTNMAAIPYHYYPDRLSSRCGSGCEYDFVLLANMQCALADHDRVTLHV